MNNSLFSFNPVFPWWLIALLVIPIFTFLIWREIKRNQRFLPFRLVAQFIVLVSILGLLLKPGYVKEINSSGLVLLTPSYDQGKVDSLLVARPELGIVHTPETNPYRDSRLLNSYYSLSDLDNEILFVVGEGLPSFALEIMDEKKFQFIASQKPHGTVQLHLPEKNRVNKQSNIQGVFNADNKTKLILRGPGGKEDSLEIKEKGANSFSLAFKPKQAGLYMYSLQYLAGTEVVTEQFPVEVTDEKKLNILFLQKFPSFEVRQVKNFLAENGHHLALRYQVSKNNYRVEFANLPSNRISSLSSSLLQTFDLVVIDSDGLESLSIAEKNTLEESVYNGLGLILLINKAVEKDKLRERFLQVEMKRVLKDTAHLNFPEKQYILPVLPLQVNVSSSIYPVIERGKRILSAYAFKGFGKTGWQFLQETYRIALEGNIDDYASIWSPLVERTARNRNELAKIGIDNQFPVYHNEPLRVEVISMGSQPTLMNDHDAVPLIEHVRVDNVWQGKSWTGKPGWHTLSVDSSTLNYFVSEPSEWSALRVTNQLMENEQVSANKSANARLEIFYQQKLVSVMIFYILFLVGSGFLWLAPKI